MDDVKSLMEELNEIVLGLEGNQSVDDVLDDYDTAREMLDGLASRPGFADSVEGAKNALVMIMNNNLHGIVKTVYESAQKNIAKAKTIDDKILALSDARELLERPLLYPEHAEDDFLQKALAAFADYDSRLNRALADQIAASSEAEFRNAVAGIQYTATDKQIRFLIDLGANPRDLDGITKQQASAMITRLKG